MLSPIHAAAASPASPERDSAAKVRDAAQQFEALLLGQILKAARGSGGWMGSSDGSSDCAIEYAEEQFATVMAKQGGLGLASLITQGLEHGRK